MPDDLVSVIVEKIQGLPIKKQQRVLDFVDSLLEEDKKTLLEKIAERVGNLSAETLEKLPPDYTEDINRYLQDTPNKTK